MFEQRNVVLPSAQLDFLQQRCTAKPDAGFCRELADEQWKAGHAAAAITAEAGLRQRR